MEEEAKSGPWSATGSSTTTHFGMERDSSSETATEDIQDILQFEDCRFRTNARGDGVQRWFPVSGSIGALNTHISDVFGTLVEQWQLDRQWIRQLAHGDGILAPTVKGVALRSLKRRGRLITIRCSVRSAAEHYGGL